jgi:hypothetical protein
MPARKADPTPAPDPLEGLRPGVLAPGARKADPALDPGDGIIRACVDRPSFATPPSASEMAAERGHLWEPGRTLRIAAGVWMEHANIRIVQVASGPSDLRCSFAPGGSWSYVGTAAKSFPGHATMNMGWPGDFARDLHELGHALGLIHEHQSPVETIPWDVDAVYRYYGGAPNFWSKEEVDQQVFEKYDQAEISNTTWDKQSIMEYPIPRPLVKDPAYAVGWNRSLSAQDIAFIGTLYPR